MHKDKPLPPVRQQKLDFAWNELWRRLPAQERLQCQELIARLLRLVVASEDQEGKDHE